MKWPTPVGERGDKLAASRILPEEPHQSAVPILRMEYSVGSTCSQNKGQTRSPCIKRMGWPAWAG